MSVRLCAPNCRLHKPYPLCRRLVRKSVRLCAQTLLQHKALHKALMVKQPGFPAGAAFVSAAALSILSVADDIDELSL